MFIRLTLANPRWPTSCRRGTTQSLYSRICNLRVASWTALREAPLNFADESAPENQHAHHEDRANDDRDPGAHDVGEILLQRHHDIGPDDRSYASSTTAEQGHENHFTGSRLT